MKNPIQYPNILSDSLAGIALAGLMLPEAVAYASIAGLAPEAGVIALFAGLISYALLGRSRFAIVAATSSSAAILAAGTVSLVGAGAVSRPLVAGMLVVLTGTLFLIASIARLGGVSHFIARPVLRGYVFGLATVIALKQLPHFLGLTALHGDFFPGLLYTFCQQLGQINLFSALTGTIALILLLASEKIPRLPGCLLVIVLGILFSGLLLQHDVALTGKIDLSFKGLAIYWPDSSQWLASLELAAALMLILYAESYSTIRNFALKEGDEVKPNRDLAVLGVANLLSGLFQGMPVGAGYSATSANEMAGAQTRLAGLIAAGVVLVLTALFLKWIECIPVPVLAAIVIHAVSKSWRLTGFKPYFKWHRDRLIALTAVIAVLTLGILNGLLIAIALSIALLIRQLAQARLCTLGRLEDSPHDFVDCSKFPAARPVTGVLILRPDEPLFFANAEAVFSQACNLIEQESQLNKVVLSLELSPDLDGTALEALNEFADALARKQLILCLSRLKPAVRELLLRAELANFPADKLSYWSVEDAVMAPLPEANQSEETACSTKPSSKLMNT